MVSISICVVSLCEFKRYLISNDTWPTSVSIQVRLILCDIHGIHLKVLINTMVILNIFININSRLFPQSDHINPGSWESSQLRTLHPKWTPNYTATTKNPIKKIKE